MLEVSVVVIGVAITLSASYWISNRSQKRDTTLYLSTIKLELEENKNMLDSTVRRLQPSVRYANYLRAHDKKSLDADTIRFYNEAYGEANTLIIKTNAFDMFKTSGNMRFVDKDLLLMIWDTYAKLDNLKQGYDGLIQMKMDEIQRTAQLFSLYDFASMPDEEILKNIPMYQFYAHISAPYIMPQMCEVYSQTISETLIKLEQAK